MGAQNWLWWCLALVLAATRTVSGFLMEGSPTSFTQFPRWVPGANGSLEFEFATREPNGLLLYTDDGGSYEFFELKLVEGSVRLHYNLGGGARLLTVGHGLNDGSWHRVKVSRSQDRTHLTVDNKSESRVMKALSPNFGSPETNSFVYLGGLPLLLTRQVGSRLTLPVVTLEPRFTGRLRGLVYTTNDGHSRSQNIIASQVRHLHSSNPAQHTPIHPDISFSFIHSSSGHSYSFHLVLHPLSSTLQVIPEMPLLLP